MNSFTRFEKCMKHETPDRPPIDLGAIDLTGLKPNCQQKLLDVLGYSKACSQAVTSKTEDTNKWDGTSRIAGGGVDERILEWAGTDFRSVGAIVKLPSPHEKAVSETCRIDCWGIRREQANGEWQITDFPLKGATTEDLSDYAWPEPRIDEKLLLEWEGEAKRLKEENRYIIIAHHPVYGILELGCWMCGYDDFLLKMALDPGFIHTFFNKVADIQLKVSETYYTVLGDYIHITTSGDDFGSQMGPLISPEMFDRLIAPYFSQRIRRTKELAQCYFWHHSCGSIYKIIDNLIRCGVDILNPIQTSAAGMDPENLKESFGEKLIFWGGVDIQNVLPFASPNEVTEYVKSLVSILGKNGGYVVAPAHQVQDDIPPENIIAMIEAIKTLQ